jgi:hypothetical protein
VYTSLHYLHPLFILRAPCTRFVFSSGFGLDGRIYRGFSSGPSNQSCACVRVYKFVVSSSLPMRKFALKSKIDATADTRFSLLSIFVVLIRNIVSFVLCIHVMQNAYQILVQSLQKLLLPPQSILNFESIVLSSVSGMKFSQQIETQISELHLRACSGIWCISCTVISRGLRKLFIIEGL